MAPDGCQSPHLGLGVAVRTAGRADAVAAGAADESLHTQAPGRVALGVGQVVEAVGRTELGHLVRPRPPLPVDVVTALVTVFLRAADDVVLVCAAVGSRLLGSLRKQRNLAVVTLENIL